MKNLIKVYFDNNIYNYLVDGQTISQNDIKKLLDAVETNKVEVLFSPVNFYEIFRCFENEEAKAKKMVEMSYKLARKTTKEQTEILLDQLKSFKNKQDFKNLGLYHSQETRFDKERNNILNIKNYKVSQKLHDEWKKIGSQYCKRLCQTKSDVNKIIEEISSIEFLNKSNDHSENYVDLYQMFNSDKNTRKLYFELIFKEKCSYTGKIPLISSFNDIPSLSIFLKFYFKIAGELVIKDKEPRSSDWADLDQTVYFYYVDYVVTSDTGRKGVFPNYRNIINQILQPMNKSAIKFSTLISKIDKMV